MQKILLAVSVLLTALVGVLVVPFVSRKAEPELLSALSVIFMLTAFMGAFDVIKPVLVKRFVELAPSNKDKIKIIDALTLSLFWGVGVSICVFSILSLFFSSKMDALSIAILSFSGVLLCLGVCLFSVLESRNKVGVAQLLRVLAASFVYIFTLVLIGFNIFDFYWYAFSFFMCQFALLMIAFLVSKKYISFERYARGVYSLSNLINTLSFNLYRVFIDFFDRFFFSYLFSPVVFSAYNVLYDVVARVNLPAQYFNAYKYPKLCGGMKGGRGKFLLQGGACFIIVYFSSLVIAPFADDLVMLYLGGRYSDYGYLLQFLVTVAAFQVLSIFSQTILRADNKFGWLQRNLRGQIVSFSVFSIIMYYSFGREGVLSAVLMLKSSSIHIFSYYFSRYFHGTSEWHWNLGFCLLSSISIFSVFQNVLLSVVYFCSVFTLCIVQDNFVSRAN